MRYMPTLLALFAFGLAVFAGVFWIADNPASTTSLTLHTTTFDLCLPPGEYNLVVRINNPAAVPRRIIGLAEG